MCHQNHQSKTPEQKQNKLNTRIKIPEKHISLHKSEEHYQQTLGITRFKTPSPQI
jgi:hypothetical protein